ncbi:MAG: hypothetical protein ACI9FJ_002095 [Alteromonadaceae bacterium]
MKALICLPISLAAAFPILGNLSELETLMLRGNQLSGSFAPQVARLSKLRALALDEQQQPLRATQQPNNVIMMATMGKISTVLK